MWDDIPSECAMTRVMHDDPDSWILGDVATERIIEPGANIYARRFASRVEDAVARLPQGACRVCVFGDSSLSGCVGSEALVNAVAQRFAGALANQTVVLASSCSGTPANFLKGLGASFPTTVHVLPEGQRSSLHGVQELRLSGASPEEGAHIFLQLGHVFIVFEGDTEVSEATMAALALGALVIPVTISTGSQGFPLAALRRPDVAAEDEWARLIHGDVPETVAKAVVAIIARYIASNAHMAERQSSRALDVPGKKPGLTSQVEEPLPNLSGSWLLDRVEGEPDHAAYNGGVNWAMRQAAHAAGYGVGLITMDMRQTGDFFDIRSSTPLGSSHVTFAVGGGRQKGFDASGSEFEIEPKWQCRELRASMWKGEYMTQTRMFLSDGQLIIENTIDGYYPDALTREVYLPQHTKPS